MALDVPRAKGVTGFVRCELRPNERVGYAAARRPLSRSASRASIVADAAGANHSCASTRARRCRECRAPTGAFPDAGHVELKGGFTPGAIYEVVYRSADPPLVGLGFLAVRDTAAWLRWAPAASGNPCAGDDRARLSLRRFAERALPAPHAVSSVSTRTSRAAWCSTRVMPHVAGGRRGEFNLRFGQPSLNAHEAVGQPAAVQRRSALRADRDSAGACRGSSRPTRRPSTGAATLRSSTPTSKAPRRRSRADFVRTYLFAGTQHTPGALPPLAADPNTGEPRPSSLQRRRLRAAAAQRARQSRPLGERGRRAAAERVSAARRRHGGEAESLGGFFRKLPGARFPGSRHAPARLDFGPDIERGIAAIRRRPARRIGRTCRPSTPTATRSRAYGRRSSRRRSRLSPAGTRAIPRPARAGDLMSMMGSTLPFALTRAERERSGDPRPVDRGALPVARGVSRAVREVDAQADRGASRAGRRPRGDRRARGPRGTGCTRKADRSRESRTVGQCLPRAPAPRFADPLLPGFSAPAAPAAPRSTQALVQWDEF